MGALGAEVGTSKITWGSNDDMAWCLSLDQNDFSSAEWDPRIAPVLHSVGQCYTTLAFRPDGQVQGWHYVNAEYAAPGGPSRFWDWLTNFRGRRALQEEDVDALPSVAECDALVDQILTWQMEHAELWADAGRVPLHAEDPQITDHVYSLEDAESSTEEAGSSTDDAESSTDNAESSTENAESSTEN